MKTLYKKIVMIVITCIYMAAVSSTSASPTPTECSQDVTLSSQADVDAFATNYCCTTIAGTLTISGSDITNLNGLSSITAVYFLTIEDNDNLLSLNGLSNLIKVAGGYGGQSPTTGFSINDNALLFDVHGLSSLFRIDQNLKIFNNPRLHDLSGLETLNYVGATLLIDNNERLTNLDGLSALTFIGAVFPGSRGPRQALVITSNNSLVV